jgi:hypothetical protein
MFTQSPMCAHTHFVRGTDLCFILIQIKFEFRWGSSKELKYKCVYMFVIG